MADYQRREKTTVRVEFVVPRREPWGADWSEVDLAIQVATRELRDSGRIDPAHDPADDMVRVTADDDSIIVFYETER